MGTIWQTETETLSVYDGSWQMWTDILPLTLESLSDNTLILPLTRNFPGEVRRLLVLEEGSQPFSGFRRTLRNSASLHVQPVETTSSLLVGLFYGHVWAIEMAQ